MRRCLFLLLFICSGALAYVPSEVSVRDSQNLSERINIYLNKQNPEKKSSLIKTLTQQLPVLQARMVGIGNIDRAYLFEYVRRHLPGAEMIDTPNLIDDDNRGITWTQAPQ